MITDRHTRSRHAIDQERDLAGYFPSRSYRHDVGVNAHMFVEDVVLGILPLYLRDTNPSQFKAVLRGEPSDIETAQRILRSLSDGNYSDLRELIISAVPRIAYPLVEEGNCFFEIVNVGKDIELASIPNDGLFRIPGYFVQVIPREDRALYGKRYLTAKSDKVWHISMPTDLGGPAKHKRLMRFLRRGSTMAPSFYLQDLDKGMQQSPFDFQAYRRWADSSVYAKTRSWGWNMRRFGTEDFTEVLWLHRRLRFKRAHAWLRRHIISELNSLFDRIGLTARISVVGLMESYDITLKMESLLSGTESLEEIYSIVSPKFAA